jgi:hypothetical protein
MLVLVLMFAGISIVSIVLAVPMIRGWVKPNPYYGFRTPKVIKDPDLWYPANARYGWWMILAGVFGLVITILPLGIDLSEDAYALMYAILTIIPLSYGIIDVFMLIRQLEHESGKSP